MQENPNNKRILYFVLPACLFLCVAIILYYWYTLTNTNFFLLIVTAIPTFVVSIVLMVCAFKVLRQGLQENPSDQI